MSKYNIIIGVTQVKNMKTEKRNNLQELANDPNRLVIPGHTTRLVLLLVNQLHIAQVQHGRDQREDVRLGTGAYVEQPEGVQRLLEHLAVVHPVVKFI